MKLYSFLSKLLFVSLLSISSSLYAAKLPNAEFLGSDTQVHHLEDYVGKGKWTTIVVWGPKCPACINEMPNLQGLYDDKDETNIDVIGLVIDYPSFSYAKLKQVQEFEEDYFITFPNLLISARMYGKLGLGSLKGTPTIILVDPKGEVSAVQLGGVPRAVIENHIAKQDAKNNALATKAKKAEKEKSL